MLHPATGREGFDARSPSGTALAGVCSRRARHLAAAVALLTGCTPVGRFIWFDSYAQSGSAKAGYVIARGDLLSVRVWNQDGISTRVRVRPDGMISLPFINDIEAAGLEPVTLARLLQTRLKEFIVNPVVTISVEEPTAMEVPVLGEVAKPGIHRLELNAGLLRALASAGGLSESASRDRIFVLRNLERPDDVLPALRIRFRYEALTQLEGQAAKFRLRPGDVVVVE